MSSMIIILVVVVAKWQLLGPCLQSAVCKLTCSGKHFIGQASIKQPGLGGKYVNLKHSVLIAVVHLY